LTERQVRWLRLAAAAAVLAGVVLAGHALGLAEYLSRDELRAAVGEAGAWGVPIFVGAYCLALLLHVPATGIMFVGIGVALYGRVPGGALAFFGSVAAVMVSFLVVRGLAGKPLAAVRSGLLRRVLAKLDERPLATVVILRVLFFAGAPVNYALALSPLRMRDYFVGSLVGLAVPALALTAFFDLIIG
jgi:uncharacterized membrane protein YdjX (TVP38/TMEM64 family)